MISVSIDKRQLQQLEKATEKFIKKFSKDLMKQVDSAALTTRGEALKNISRNKTTNEGFLAASIKVLRKPDQHKARVFTDAGYGLYVEYGRTPGKRPPIDRIERWVNLKLRLKGKEGKAAAFNIAKKIGMHGTKPQPFMRPAFEVGRKQLVRNVQRMVDKL